MMAQDQDEMIIEGSDYTKAIASNKQHGGVTGEGFVPDGDEVDEDYMVFLVESGALAVEGKGGKVDEGSKRLSVSEEIRREWLNMEKAMNAADSDEEIQGGDGLAPEKALSDADSDVPGEACEIEARKGVDGDEGVVGSDGEEDDYDPDYLQFYQHLKPCGIAYVLETAIGNDIKIVKYEDENESLSSDERKRKVPNPVGRPPGARRRNALHREMKNLEIDCDQLSRDGNLPQRRSKGEGDRKVPNPVGRPPGARRRNALHREMKNLEIDCDQLSRRGNLPQRRSKGERDGKVPNPVRLVPSARRNVLDGEMRNLEIVCGQLKRQGNSTQRHRKGERDKKWERVQIPYHEKIDKDYYLFLGGLQICGNSLLYEGDDSIQYIYDESAESASDSDIEGSPNPLPSVGRMIPEPSNKRLVSSGKRVPSNENVEVGFRQGVMDILLKPYDKKEHEDLLYQVRERKPIVRSHEMRNRSVQFSDERSIGRSYLDHHDDLRKKIKAVQRDDPYKALHLLRGFFYYIQRPCRDDSFKPWNDNLWLEAMNRSTSQKHH